MARILYRGRFFFALLALALTGFFAFYALKIEFNLSPEAIFIEGDPAYEFYKNTYLPEFSYLGVPSILAIEAKGDTSDLSMAIQRAALKLRENPFIKQVISPLDQTIPIPTKNGLIGIPSAKDGKLSPLAIDYFLENPLFKGVFLGQDQKSMALTFMLDLEFQNHQRQEEVVKSVNQDIDALKKELKGYELYLTGLPFVQSEVVSLLKSDQLRLLPLLGLLVIILLLLMTKSPLGTLYPMLIISVAIIWTLGFLSLLGHEINVVNNSIIILILVIGIADSVHIYTRFVEESIKGREQLKRGKDLKRSDIIEDTVKAMLLPCFLTSATTALGFFASSAAGVEIIQEFGYVAACGVIFCFFATFMLMPTLLNFHPIPKSHHAAWLGWWPKKLSIDRLLQWSIGKSLRYAKMLSALALILIVLSAIASRGISSKQTWLGELPDDDPAMLAFDFVEKNFGGVMPFYVVFSGEHEKLASYETALAIDDIANQLRSDAKKPVIRSPIDSVDFLLKKMGLELSQIDTKTFEELSALIDGQDTMFWSKDKKHLRLQGYLPNIPTSEAEEFRRFVEATAKTLDVKGVTATVTGPALIASHALHNITNDMKNSLGLAVLYITIFIALFFRSLRYALIAMMPNLLPIGLTISLMSIFDMDVRLATVMIFSMALGLSIDTCIHLLCRAQEEIGKDSKRFQKLSLIRSIHRAFKGSGRPIIYTTAILLGGFSIMLFSRFLAMRDFGIISIIVILSALLADIILLPALIFVTRPRKVIAEK